MIKEVKNDKTKIKIHVVTEFEENRYKTFFSKEPETISWIEEIVQPGDIFYDIGANIGVFSLYVSGYHKEKVEVIAFEPVFHNFSKLCENVILNNFNNSIKPYCIILGDKTCPSRINLASTVSGSASHAAEGINSEFLDNFKSEFVQGIYSSSLDDFVESSDCRFPNHLKIDTDGFEDKVIFGSKKILSDKRLKSILIEFDDKNKNTEKIMNLIIKSGFRNDHRINNQKEHSKYRRQKNNSSVKNVIFTR